MPTTTTVIVEVFNLATFQWLPYGFAGSKPGFTCVDVNGGMWFPNSSVRFPRNEN